MLARGITRLRSKPEGVARGKISPKTSISQLYYQSTSFFLIFCQFFLFFHQNCFMRVFSGVVAGEKSLFLLHEGVYWGGGRGLA